MNTKKNGTVNPKKQNLLLDTKEIDSLINKYQGILSIVIKEKFGEANYEFIIHSNSSSLIDFLKLEKYKNVSFKTVSNFNN